jgi:ribosome-associated heat shock protein Hsp15
MGPGVRPASSLADCQTGRVESTRVDRWLWSVRVFKTRTVATEACKGGHVSVNRGITKPATAVKVGDVVTIRLDGRDRLLEVVEVIDKRVGAARAGACYLDQSPPPSPAALGSPGLVRDGSAGRPTKRDRRLIDRLRDRHG